MAIEADVRYRIDRTLENKDWDLNPESSNRNIFFESRLPGEYAAKPGRKRPDYTLFQDDKLIGVIEAKKQGSDLDKALAQGSEYAKKLNAPFNIRREQHVL